MIETPQPPLAHEIVRYAGEPVALVVALTAAAARDALELIDVAYEPLPAVAQARDAVAPGAPQLFPEAPGNLAFDLDYGDAAATEAAIAAADLVLTHEFTNQRVIAAHMEPRAAFASYDAATGTYEITAGGQGVIRHRAAAAGALGVPLDRVRYVTPGCRRRVRRAQQHPRRTGPLRLGRAPARAPGALDERSLRRLHHRLPRPRHRRARDDGARPRRHDPRAALR